MYLYYTNTFTMPPSSTNTQCVRGRGKLQVGSSLSDLMSLHGSENFPCLPLSQVHVRQLSQVTYLDFKTSFSSMYSFFLCQTGRKCLYSYKYALLQPCRLNSHFTVHVFALGVVGSIQEKKSEEVFTGQLFKHLQVPCE